MTVILKNGGDKATGAPYWGNSSRLHSGWGSRESSAVLRHIGESSSSIANALLKQLQFINPLSTFKPSLEVVAKYPTEVNHLLAKKIKRCTHMYTRHKAHLVTRTILEQLFDF